jgi:hypothetical protein
MHGLDKKVDPLAYNVLINNVGDVFVFFDYVNL